MSINIEDIVKVDVELPKFYYLLCERDGSKYIETVTERQIDELCVIYDESKEDFINNHTVPKDVLKEIQGKCND